MLLRSLTPTDLPQLKELVEQAGWNQTDADLTRFVTMAGQDFIVAEVDGRVVGTTAALPLSEKKDVAWIAMVLVDEAARGQGIGRAMMQEAIRRLDAAGVPSIRLDATPLGQPLYEKLGFVAEFELVRYRGTLPQLSEHTMSRETSPADSLLLDVPADPLALEDEITSFVQMLTGNDRSSLLRLLIEQEPESLRVVRRRGRRELAGFLLSRAGRLARMIGPVMALGPAGSVLLADAWRQYAGQPVIADIPISHRAACQSAEHIGLTVQRPLLRMCRGPAVREPFNTVWASSGPETG